MSKVQANGITINYEQQGTGEPLVFIPYLAADHACYAFQVADYAKHFTCISVDPRGAGGVERAHVSGLSLGAATALWLAGKYPQRVKSLSLHSCWPKSDAFLKTVVGSWQSTAKGLNSVTEMIIQGILPWCFTPDFYSSKPEFMDQVVAFVRSRPKQPLDAFMRQSNAVIAHDAVAQLARIKAPTQITFGRHDQVTSLRFADALTTGINGSELTVFETCAHAPIYQSTAEFNEKTLGFLKKHIG
jgi:pimeloyl-ACP methyl ester carboxylesterase